MEARSSILLRTRKTRGSWKDEWKEDVSNITASQLHLLNEKFGPSRKSQGQDSMRFILSSYQSNDISIPGFNTISLKVVTVEAVSCHCFLSGSLLPDSLDDTVKSLSISLRIFFFINIAAHYPHSSLSTLLQFWIWVVKLSLHLLSSRSSLQRRHHLFCSNSPIFSNRLVASSKNSGTSIGLGPIGVKIGAGEG